jgi:hypothetical protein
LTQTPMPVDEATFSSPDDTSIVFSRMKDKKSCLIVVERFNFGIWNSYSERGSERRKSEHRRVRTSKDDQNVERSERQKSEHRKERQKSNIIKNNFRCSDLLWRHR